MKINDLKFDKRNYRKHNDKNLALIKKSVNDVGLARSIVIDNENEIICGNGLVSQLSKNTPVKVIETDGSELVVVKRIDLKTDDDKRKHLAVLDNSTSESSDFDMTLLQEDFDVETLNDLGIEIEIENPEIEEVEEYEVPEEVETRAKLGDIWQLGKHRLMCGDSTSITDVEKLMNGVKADMVFTDPPYNVASGDKNKALQTFQKAGRITENIKNDVFKTDKECGEKLWLPAFTNMILNSNDNCSIYVTMPQGGTHMMMMMMMNEAGWQVKHELIWVKNSPTFSMGRLDYDYQHEPICFGWNKGHKKIGKGKFTKSIWQIDKPKKCDIHPTMKPIELIENALLNSSELNDYILDLFGGSGSTLIACEQLNRKCYMMELDPHYCDVILQRYINFKGSDADVFLLKDGKKIPYSEAHS